MKRFGSLRNAAAVLVLGGLVAAGVAVATAQAAPSKKNFTVQVAVTKPTSGPVNAQNFTITLANDGSSNTTLGSANILPPAGFAVDTASTEQSGWTATPTPVGDVVALRSTTSAAALAPGHSMTVSVHVASPTLPTICSSATWSAQVKQSNDFNGTNNWFTQLLAKSDMTPLGSYAWDPIGTTVDGVFAPAIYTTRAVNYPSPSPTVHALDSCGAPKTGYSGPTTLAYSGAPDKVTVSGPSPWSASGVGTVSIAPTISETNRSLTLTDFLTGIKGTSDPFDTQDKLCTSVDISCTWGNGNSINASAHGPAQGSLGVGFNPVVPFSCSGGTVPLGNSVITIAPHGTSNPNDQVAYQVTIVYSKQVSGTGSANAFAFCESTTDGASWTLLPSCSAPAGTTVDCVFDQKRVTGGALQVILSLVGDPYVGGR
jgi:hypothetical protein